jgi:hypothetical protein
MSIDHNRIKVADLEQNQPNRILITNQNGELEFTDINNIKIDSFNGLDYTAEGKTLDARQGKVLKDKIDIVNATLLEKENLSNKVQDIETYKNSSTAFSSIKALYDWATSRFKTWLLGIENISAVTYTLNIASINKRTVFTSLSPVTITVPINSSVSIPIGSKFEYTQKGDGVITIEGVGITFVTNLSLKTVQGETRSLTKIDTDTWSIEGNSISIKTNIAYDYYIDTINGNNSTAVAGDMFKPFKTIDAALAIINTSTFNRFILMTSGTYYINNSYVAELNLEFYSKKDITISFVNNTNTLLFGNVINGTNLIFDLQNGSIILSNTVIQYFSRGNYTVICKSLHTGTLASPNPVFSAATTFNAIIEKCTTYRGGIASIYNSSKVSKFTCYDFILHLAGGSVFNGSTTNEYCIVDLSGTISGSGYMIIVGPKGYYKIGNITTTGGNTILSGSSTLFATIEFLNSTISGTYVDVTGWNLGKLTLTGAINTASTAVLKATNISQGTLILKDFTCDLKASSLFLYTLPKLILNNTNIKCNGVPFTRFSTATTTIELYGTNSIVSASPTIMVGASNTAPVIFNDYGDFRTNIPSLGTLITYNNLCPISFSYKDVISKDIPVYNDNTEAINGGLITGKKYRTPTGILMIVY